MTRPRYKKRSRLPDWESRLFTFLNESRNREMVWGDFDCVVGLASGAVEAQTGVDLAQAYKGAYATEAAALKLVVKHGFADKNTDLTATLTRLMDKHLQRAPKGDRHRGNIILLESDEGPGFGVRTGSDVVALARDGGTRMFKAPKGALEWTVI